MYASQQGKRLIDEHLVRHIIEHEMLEVMSDMASMSDCFWNRERLEQDYPEYQKWTSLVS